jgi:hypothetical protein
MSVTIIGLILPIAGLIKVLWTGSKATCDSIFSQLHYQVTFTVILVMSLFVTGNNLIGDRINCTGNSIAKEVMNDYCWTEPRFTPVCKYNGL